MTTRNFGMSMALLVGLAVSATTHAMPLTWTLSDVTFLFGGDATGSFVFDADTGIYSNVDIITTLADGTTVRGDYGNVVAGLSATALQVGTIEMPPPLAGRDLLLLSFQSALTDSGGIVPLDVTNPPPRSFELTCVNIACSDTSNTRLVLTGSVTHVPEPTTLSLLGLSILAGLALGRRRRA